ncbi:hypothetical protein VTN02DRAFT_4876 [Thermoascus thermophilus]
MERNGSAGELGRWNSTGGRRTASGSGGRPEAGVPPCGPRTADGQGQRANASGEMRRGAMVLMVLVLTRWSRRPRSRCRCRSYRGDAPWKRHREGAGNVPERPWRRPPASASCAFASLSLSLFILQNPRTQAGQEGDGIHACVGRAVERRDAAMISNSPSAQTAGLPMEPACY